jgi:hypothetical protein
MRRLPLLPVLTAALILAASIGALAVLGGWAGRAYGEALSADVRLQDFRLPADFRLDPDEIAADLSVRLAERAERDVAMRLLFGEENQARLREVALPRLLNAGVIRRMTQETAALGTVLAVAGYRGLATVTVTNHAPLPQPDTAMTMPGALRAETADGERLDLRAPAGEVPAVRVGTLAPGETRTLFVWLEAVPDAAAARTLIRIGAAGGLDGRIDLHAPGRNWFGADLELFPWARWLVAGVLAAIAALAAAALLLIAAEGLRPARRPHGAVA